MCAMVAICGCANCLSAERESGAPFHLFKCYCANSGADECGIWDLFCLSNDNSLKIKKVSTMFLNNSRYLSFYMAQIFHYRYVLCILP